MTENRIPLLTGSKKNGRRAPNGTLISEQFPPLLVNFLVLSGATTFTSSDFFLEPIITNKRKLKLFFHASENV